MHESCHCRDKLDAKLVSWLKTTPSGGGAAAEEDKQSVLIRYEPEVAADRYAAAALVDRDAPQEERRGCFAGGRVRVTSPYSSALVSRAQLTQLAQRLEVKHISSSGRMLRPC